MSDTPIEDSIKALHYARTRKKEPPPWWPAVEAILNEHGLQAIDFVADFKAARAALGETNGSNRT